MICRTRSGSALAITGRLGRAQLQPRAAQVGARAELARHLAGERAEVDAARPASPSPPASSWERSSRSAVSLVRRSICSRIVRTNSARSSGLGSSSSSSSTKPPRLKIGVRSSCEALAMNCLRALSSSASRRCISLKVRASWPSWPDGGDRDRGFRSCRRRPCGRRPGAGGCCWPPMLGVVDADRERRSATAIRPPTRICALTARAAGAPPIATT